MRRRTRIASSAAAAGAILAGAGTTIAAMPVDHAASTVRAAVWRGMPQSNSVDAALAAMGMQSQTSQHRIAELERDIARVRARIQAEAARRAARILVQQRAQLAQATAAANQGGSGQVSVLPVTRITRAALPAVHTTTRASGTAVSSASDGKDGTEND